MESSDAHNERPSISIWAATKAGYQHCPVCGSAFGARRHRPGCDFMRKRAIGMGIALGGPALVGTAIFGGVSGVIALVFILTVGFWWVVRRANAVEPEPPGTP